MFILAPQRKRFITVSTNKTNWKWIMVNGSWGIGVLKESIGYGKGSSSLCQVEINELPLRLPPHIGYH
jgi:hypothetical protein